MTIDSPIATASVAKQDTSLDLLRHFVRSLAATRHAAERGAPGLDFARYGRRIGLQMLIRRSRPSISYLIAPVSSTRYFEFPFALGCLPQHAQFCLDVSSPSLFSFYVASKRPGVSIRMINPDPMDCANSQAVISRLRTNGLELKNLDLAAALATQDKYDCVWSLSVIEHISGRYDDRDAAAMMYAALRPSGRLILTFPVDRRYWDEYRERDAYGLQAGTGVGRYFFQRYYDREAIWERIVRAVRKEPSVVRWFGELEPGRFSEYEKRWMREGYACVADDAREIADHYQEFQSWEEMPGKGVCGLAFDKEGA